MDWRVNRWGKGHAFPPLRAYKGRNEAVIGCTQMPGFVVYLYQYRNWMRVTNPLN